ncbi:hypothetical protein JTE90_019634 [Oedothorax gibbosus]|uniref:CNH domain-containing protein n=1 Tax=Oedothorax gibbosus TaxID=931172 RepID=A0AAV6TY06_9ARAC|nr:hypothetical protein JTE90_019634 [Oedothorax gibbosus]
MPIVPPTTPTRLPTNVLWFSGPEFLRKHEISEYDSFGSTIPEGCASELKKGFSIEEDTCLIISDQQHIFVCLRGVLRLYSAPTEKLQAWHQPTKVKLSPKKTDDVYKRTSSRAFSGIDIGPPFTGQLSRQLMSVLPIVATETLKCTQPLPACVFTCNHTTVLDQLPTDAAEFVKEKLVVNLKDIWELEQLTISQSESSLWKYQRKWRLTASNFYKVCVRRKDHTKLASTLLSSHSSDLSRIPAIAYGNKYESLTLQKMKNKSPLIMVVDTICVKFFFDGGLLRTER